MGILDVIKKAGNAAMAAITNPISTAVHVVTAPVKMVNRIVDTANSLDEMPKKMVELLAGGICQYPEVINSVTVFREPVNKFVVGAAKILTVGKLTTKIRHVFEVFEIYNVKYQAWTYIRVEKNEVVEYKIISKDQFEGLKRSHEYMEIKPHDADNLSLKLFFDNYIQRTNPKVLWLYDPITANCQVFVYLGLVANEKYFTMTSAIENFIVQKDVKHEVKGISKDIMKGITTVANFSRRFVGLASGTFFDGNEGPLERAQRILGGHECQFADLLNTHAELVYNWATLGRKIEKILKSDHEEHKFPLLMRLVEKRSREE